MGIAYDDFGNIRKLSNYDYDPLCQWNRCQQIENSFWTIHIWILHLAFVELMVCMFTIPVVFVMPYLGIRNIQVQGMDTSIGESLYFRVLTIRLDWLLLFLIVMTRSIKLKNPEKWDDVCENKINDAICLVLPWLISSFYILRDLLDPTTECAYNCLLGLPADVPTIRHK